MKKKVTVSKKNEEWWLLVPIIFALAIIPLVLRFGIYIAPLSEYTWLGNTHAFLDLYLYGKYKAMMLLEGVLLIGLIYLCTKKQIPKHIAFVPMGAYAILIVLSTIFSVNSFISLNGYPEIMESVYVLLGYCMIWLYAYSVVKTEKQLKVIMFAFFIGIGIICFIGVLHYFGFDILMSDFMKALCFAKEHSGYAMGMQAATTGVASTLYNPNYLGVYCCMVTPILATLLCTVSKKKNVIIYLLLLGMVAVCLKGAISETPIIILALFVVVLFIYILKWSKKQIKVIFSIGIVLGIGFLGFIVSQNNGENLKSLLPSFVAESIPKKEYVIDGIILNDEDFVIIYQGDEIRMKFVAPEVRENGLYAEDSQGNEIPFWYSEEFASYHYDDERYTDIVFIPLEIGNFPSAYKVVSQGIEYIICYSATNESYYYLNSFARLTKIYSSETFDLPIFHILGGFSGRDYIWGKSLPILKETIFIGSGPDTFPFMFPQYDYVDLKQAYSNRNVIVNKPHNTYLQIGIQTGVLSLLAYLSIFGCYFIESFKIYRKRRLMTFIERCGAGIFGAVCCYMVSGIMNDSHIGVSIVFWTLLGLGFACNKMIKQSEDVAVTEKNVKLDTIIKVGVISLISILIIIIGHLLLHRNDGVYTDGRAVFKVLAEQEDNSNLQSVSYRAVMNVEWTFADGSSVSEDAYVENATDNVTPVYFDVKLESGEVIYTSDVLNVGSRLDSIILEKDLEAGEYPVIVTYHILSDDGIELATADVDVVVKVLH